MEKLTNLLSAGRMEERRKSSRKNATISGIKVQSIGRAEMKATGRVIDAVVGLHSPVLRTQHQGN